MISDVNSPRSGLGISTSHPPKTPFSHIQIIPKSSTVESTHSNGSSPPLTFRSPSYSQEAEQRMAAPYNLQGSSFTASLANNISGTTFAARARAAELNAVRSRKAAREMETAAEVPSLPPVPLGALKFSKPRARGRGWTALHLGQLPEEALQGNEANGDDSQGAERSAQKRDQGIMLHHRDTLQNVAHGTL